MGKIYKTLIFDNRISLAVLDTTDIVNEAIKIHGLSPVCAAALGRTLTATAFMASCLKDENSKLSVTIDGGGLGGKIVTAGNANGNVRGCIYNPQVDAPLKKNGKLDVSAVVGKNGYITVVKDLGMKEPYVGRCRLISGEIAEDFTAYYAYSEQQPTAMAIGVLIGKGGLCSGAGAVIVQPLPNCPEEDLTKAECLINCFDDISLKISDDGGDGVCKKYFPEYAFTETETYYKCNCSQRYIDKVLISLGKDEFLDTVEKEGKVEVGCEFCNRKYVYTAEDVDRLFGTQDK